MGLGIQFPYRNAVFKGPQAQPFGKGNFDVHENDENDENELTIGLCFFEARWILSATQCLSAPRLCCGWPWLRFETLGCPSSRRDGAQPRNFWLAEQFLAFFHRLILTSIGGCRAGRCGRAGGTSQFIQRNCEPTDFKTHRQAMRRISLQRLPYAWSRLLQTSISRAWKPGP